MMFKITQRHKIIDDANSTYCSTHWQFISTLRHEKKSCRKLWVQYFTLMNSLAYLCLHKLAGRFATTVICKSSKINVTTTRQNTSRTLTSGHLSVSIPLFAHTNRFITNNWYNWKLEVQLKFQKKISLCVYLNYLTLF